MSLDASRIPERPNLSGLEEKWNHSWNEQGVYHFDRSASREEIYAIDTPPPTVSGSLHIGHVFSYTHTDCIARYQRMQGKMVFYPMGWDDNGLPTERRVQNYYGVRCDPHVAYDPEFEPPAKPGKQQVPISRENFITLCHQLTQEDEQVFEDLWRHLGLSVDWRYSYTTIDDNSRAAAQRAFLRNLAKGQAYQAEAPTLWDVTFRTAVAQAELEDRERPGAYHRIGFTLDAADAAVAESREDGATIYIETTRPELIAACVALVAHPDDERYQPLFGKTVRTPLFDVPVPVVAHRLAEPDKGSGIAMICTFGDTTDVTWWRELQLPTRPIIDWNGRIVRKTPEWITCEAGRSAFEALAGATAFTARERIAELLTESGALVGEPKTISHPVKYFEKGEKTMEIVTTRQWYIRNGGRDEELRQQLVAQGEKVTWYPGFMQSRYRNWVEGLNGDWLISRQRFFGVPFPVWYRLDEHGNPDYENPLVPEEAELPIDPTVSLPAGYSADQRDQPGGFTADEDVMDTWATSSLSPQIAGGWVTDEDLFRRVYPMDLRPQGHDIIRTWLFSTMVRSYFEEDSVPWYRTILSGWILDPDRKKMSKSKGNVVTPAGLLDKHGTDAVRYWAASGRPGMDTAFDEQQMAIGRKLAVKILNAGKFALAVNTDAASGKVTEPLDLAVLAELAEVVETATQAYEDYNYTKALDVTENFFWTFCDDYIELVKDRARNAEGHFSAEAMTSAVTTLRRSLAVLLRLFAPAMPFVAEEVWSWWRDGSIHRTSWPTVAETLADTPLAAPDASGVPATTAGSAYTVAAEVLGQVRRAKSDAQVSIRTEVLQATVQAPTQLLEVFAQVQHDVAAAGKVREFTFVEAPAADPNDATSADAVVVTCVLGDPPPKRQK